MFLNAVNETTAEGVEASRQLPLLLEYSPDQHLDPGDPPMVLVYAESDTPSPHSVAQPQCDDGSSVMW